MDQLNQVDSVFLYTESPNTPMHVGGLALYDPSTFSPDKKQKIGFQQIVEFVSDRTHLAKPFLKKLSRVPFDIDFAHWVDDPDFDIAEHVRHYSLPKPGTWDQLRLLTQDLFAQPLDMDKPLWMFIYIDGIDSIEGVPKGSFAILSKAHHCAIDGASGVDIASATHTLSPEFKPLKIPASTKPLDPPSTLAKLVNARGFFSKQLKSARLITEGLVPTLLKSNIDLIRSNNWRPSLLVPHTRFNRDVSKYRVFGESTISLEEVKAIASLVEGATVNDVVLTIVSGALRAYLEPLNELPKRSLIAMTPISLKSKKRNAQETGNNVANMAVKLHTEIAKPMQRLAAIRKSTLFEKTLVERFGPQRLAELNKLTPSVLASFNLRLYARLGVNTVTRTNVNTLVTNVPGPKVPLYFCGSKLIKQVNMAPLFHGAGLVHTVFSYCGEITIGFLACQKMMDTPAEYEACLNSSIKSLKAESNYIKVLSNED